MWLKRILSSELGQVPDADYRDSTPGLDESTVDASSETEVENVPEQQVDEPQTEVTPQPDDQQAAPGQPEAFDETSLNLDPNTFTPENRAIFKKMQAAFTQKMQQFAPLQEKAEIVDRFYNDKQYAYDTLRQWASQNGLQVLPMGQDPATGKPTATQGQNKIQAPAEIVNTLKQNLPEGTEWLAESLAPGLWSLLSGMLQPIAAQNQEQRKQARLAEYDKYETELSTRYPTWFEHEDRMDNLLNFLEDKNSLYSKEWGSKLSLVHEIATRMAQDVAKKQTRTANAKQHAQPRPRQAAPSNVDPELAILKAKTSSDAFDLAAKHAKTLLKR